MKSFEVTITTSSEGPTLRMTLDAAHWMAAWKGAMSELGITCIDEADMRCAIRPDGAVEVSLPDQHGRRFVVSSDAIGEGTTQDQPAQPTGYSQRPSITIEEMPAICVEDQPTTRPVGRRTKGTQEPNKLYPAVYRLDGDQEGILRESCSMLAGHISAQYVQFLLPNEDRSGWQVALSHGRHGEGLETRELSSSDPLPGPVNQLSGRRRFEAPVALTFTEPEKTPVIISVRSGLWSAVRTDGVLRGVFLLLNSERSAGFLHEELGIVQRVADLVTDRLS